MHSPNIGIFSLEIGNFCYLKKYRYRLYFNQRFLILLIFFESLQVLLIKVVAILMISAKFATLGLLEIKVFLNKGYDVEISIREVTKIILSRGSNYIVDVVIKSKFSNFSISMTEDIITSIL